MTAPICFLCRHAHRVSDGTCGVCPCEMIVVREDRDGEFPIRRDRMRASGFRVAGRRVRGERKASYEEQHARYIDCGPVAWDDR